MLASENRERSLNNYEQIKFINFEPSSKRKLPNKSIKPISKSKVSFEEIDGVFVPGLTSSMGSFIGTLARNTKIVDRKSRYFVSLGMNSILDLTDNTSGSQLHHLSPQSIEACLSMFETTKNNTSNFTIDQYEKLLDYDENNFKKYVKNVINRIKYSRIQDSNDIIRDVYEHLFKLHLYSPDIFKEGSQEFLSEQDYVIKIWGQLIEIIFRETGIYAHWGDTVSDQVLSAGARFRMDLRLLNRAITLKKTIDVANAEFSKEQQDHKYYKDILKAVLSSKIQLNSLISGHPNITKEEIKKIKIPFNIISGMVCDVYSIGLESSGLYIINEVAQMKIPTTLRELKNGGISQFLKSLFMLKEMCLNIKNIHNEKDEILRVRNIKVIKKNKNKYHSILDTEKLTWIRDLWLPPPMKDGDEDSDD